MGHKPYPRPDRTVKYARLHGVPVRSVALAPFALSGDFPPEEEERIRRVLDVLPDGMIEFISWFPRPA